MSSARTPPGALSLSRKDFGQSPAQPQPGTHAQITGPRRSSNLSVQFVPREMIDLKGKGKLIVREKLHNFVNDLLDENLVVCLNGCPGP